MTPARRTVSAASGPSMAAASTMVVSHQAARQPARASFRVFSALRSASAASVIPVMIMVPFAVSGAAPGLGNDDIAARRVAAIAGEALPCGQR